MRIRQAPLHLPLAHTHAKKAALADRVGCIAKLCARVDVWVQKAVNPPRKVLRGIVSKTARRHDRPCKTDQQDHRRTGDKVHDTPTKQQQSRLAKVRLHRQNKHNDQKQPKR